MRFSELLKSSRIPHTRHGRDVEVADLTDDSRQCHGGSCFIAVRGTAADGHKFIAAAVAAGCAAIVCQDPAAVPAGMPHAIVGESHLALGHLAQAFLAWPARKLTAVGVTGTNGKTTVTCLLEGILQAGGQRVGRLGTIGYSTGLRFIPAPTTTPSPLMLAQACDEMVRCGCQYLVMEVSSHALAQDRAAGIAFRTGVFTNLTGDHLDYHGTMEAYAAAKRRLFEQLDATATAVLNRDDPSADALADAAPGRVMWYGLSSAADLYAKILRLDETGGEFDLIEAGQSVRIRTPLIGRHNVSNSVAAAAAARSLGVEMDTIAQGLQQVSLVRGRLERVPADAPFEVFVDYAHTDDALANVLGALRPITSGRIIVVFGCGGDRDRTKRPRMAAVAQSMADRVVVTSDNPRGEEPAAIIDEIMTGFGPDAAEKVEVESDRRSAIALAISRAGKGDVVLIAGKGHECEQIIGKRRVHFDDVEVARQLLAQRDKAP
ncbi:MAG: UDP-N-acetylmuramoyl-L-alanyl-D-glutamate--2,6-diaminopimelate ligase [Planctomycetaceae bacterium]|nr:UDP-N-acetylmuramoyl-L-alanyl-D-glutamate--2,6-diaminopimelate ligase [Planctomycetaceae bacterium]